MNRFQQLRIRAGAVLISLMLTVGLLGTLPPSAASASTNRKVFHPVADALVTASHPGTNYGTSTSLDAHISPNVRSYLRFTVSGLNGLPIKRVKLKVFVRSSSSHGLKASVVSNDTWGERTITYNNMPAIGSGLDLTPAVSAGTWVRLNVTSYVKTAGTYSFAVTTAGSTSITFDSRQAATNQPRLVIRLGGTTQPPPSSSSIKHVFVVVMENHGYSQVWNTRSTPYITKLGNSYARATNYHATSHPSLPNYLDMYAGSNYSITNDCSPSSSCHVNARNLADNLQAKGLTWKGYMESMPSPCYLKTSRGYAPKHNPFIYFDDVRNSSGCAARDVPLTALVSDLRSAGTTPNYSMIVPNLCNDMHDCSTGTGDSWLKNHIPSILSSPACTVDKCLVVVTWDEDDGSQSNHVLTVFAGSGAKTGGATSSASYNHYSLLRTVEAIFGLPTQTTRDAAASTMTALLR